MNENIPMHSGVLAPATPDLDVDKACEGWPIDLGFAYPAAGNVVNRDGPFEEALEKYQAGLWIFERPARAALRNRSAAAMMRQLKQKRGPAGEQLQAAAAAAPSGNVTGHGYLLIHQTRS
jgi:hypothetical protein